MDRNHLREDSVTLAAEVMELRWAVGQLGVELRADSTIIAQKEALSRMYAEKYAQEAHRAKQAQKKALWLQRATWALGGLSVALLGAFLLGG